MMYRAIQVHAPPPCCRALLGAAIAALVLSAAASTAGSERMIVVLARGNVEVGSGEPPLWHPAQEGESLGPGDVIRTGYGARAEVRCSSGTMRLYENSLLRFPTQADDTNVSLEEGSSLFDILRRDKDSGFEVETPEVVVMVKGTRFFVSLDEGTTAVAVYRGLVAIQDLDETLEHEVLVRPGFTLIGGAGNSFELTVNPEPDPWDQWLRGERPLRWLKERLAQPPPASAAVEQAQETARAAARAELVELALETRPEVARRLAERRVLRRLKKLATLEEMKESDPEAYLRLRQRLESGELDGAEFERLQAMLAEIDGVLDAGADTPVDGLTKQVQEEFAEGVLDGTTGVPDPVNSSFDVDFLGRSVHIAGPGGIDVQINENDLHGVLETGDPSCFGGPLLNALSMKEIDPMSFARMLERGLGP